MTERSRHRPVRRWWSPWRLRCACGCTWYPCPDARPDVEPPSAEALLQAEIAVRQALPEQRRAPRLAPAHQIRGVR